MSRRREAAELARALQLSTQEAKTVSNLSPHTISSSKSNSQDSREMELKTVAPVYKRLTSSADLPPVVGTYAQDMAGVNTSTPRHLPMLSSMVDPIVTAVTPSNSIKDLSSNIQSFTPTRTPQLNPSIPPHVPATSSVSRNSPTTSGSAGPPTTSSSKSKPPFSSPNMPIPSSRLSGDKSHVSSSGSSHRPLFSPTQMSAKVFDPPAASANAPPKARPVVTYGKAKVPSPVKISGTSALTTARGHSPLKAADPPLLQTTYTAALSVSSDEEEEEIEDRAQAKAPPMSTVEVVVPARASAKKPPPPSSTRSEKFHSPDPLDSNISREVSNTPSAIAPSSSRASTKAPIKTPTVASSSRSKTPARTETQGSDKASEPSRISARQQVRKDKEEKEKEAKREARRIRKEKERLEQEAKEREELEARRSGLRGKRGRDDIEESIVALDSPVKKTPTRASRRKGDGLVDVIEVLDETLDKRHPLDKHERRSMSPRKVVSPVKKSSLVQARKEGRIAEEDQDDEDVIRVDEERHGTETLAPTAKKAAATTQKKRKRADEDEEEEDEWNDGDDDDEETLVAKPKKAVTQRKTDKWRPVKATAKGKAAAKSTQRPISNREGQPETETAQPVEEEEVHVVKGKPMDEVADPEDEEEVAVMPEKAKVVSPSKSVATSEITIPTHSTSRPDTRSPLKQTLDMVNTPSPGPSHRDSPGPNNTPGGVKWKTARNDLASVLSKFGGARQSGMSRRNKIIPLHAKIGPPVKALPPPPPKASKKKKDESEEEDSDEAEMESDGEGGMRKKKKVKGMEWYMMED